ncbi:CheY-like superfamily [Ophiocordyceps sinensis CO18]|nr:CheY-like superfamily [Ophiocordyceps sinensis CO18]
MPHSRTHSSSSDHQGLPTVKTPKPKSPGPLPESTPARVATPPPRIASPRSSSARPKKSKKVSEYPAGQTGSMLNGTVPPISVLIVEDNPINLKLLEAFVKRLKVRWQTAMNGRDAVKKWRTGGFHLVLMDIQLPVMNGLDATREIRRLERVNSIGVFTSLPSGMQEDEDVSGELKEQDRLETPSLFKSPVIIVALTASSLQSDRHEALAAGCNDFLTKPVNFVWLERKVMEWGCMQALIDFDGWRKWKDYGQLAEETEASKKALGKSKRARSSLSSST